MVSLRSQPPLLSTLPLPPHLLPLTVSPPTSLSASSPLIVPRVASSLLPSRLLPRHPHRLLAPCPSSRYYMPSSQSSRKMVPASHSSGAMTEIEKNKVSVENIPSLELTYLEGNSWLWEISGVRVLVDPVLVGNLDFGIPWLYDGAKKQIKDFKLDDLPDLDLLLITQGYDDHCHKRTLEPLSKILPDLRVISTPNAETILSKMFQKVSYLEPGSSMKLRGNNGSEITVRASPGPVLGPPWQRPENGYFLEAHNPHFKIYYEPHCVYNRSQLGCEKVDVIISPVIKQVLPGYTLVSGLEDAVELTRLLQAKVVVTMNNGDLESKGILSSLLSAVGSTDQFRDLIQKDLPNVQVLEPAPGIPLKVPILS